MSCSIKRDANGNVVNKRLSTKPKATIHLSEFPQFFTKLLIKQLHFYRGKLPPRACIVCQNSTSDIETYYSDSETDSIYSENTEDFQDPFFLLPRNSFAGITDSGFIPDLLTFESHETNAHLYFQGGYYLNNNTIRDNFWFPNPENLSFNFLSRNQHILRPEIDFQIACILANIDPAAQRARFPW